MKVTIAVISSLILSFAAFVSALPAAAKPDVKDEVEVLPFENQFPVVDTGIVGGPFSNPFDGLFQSLEGLMTRIRNEMTHLIRGSGLPNATEDLSPSALPGFPVFPQIDLGKGNTTSVTKVIDGHKVVINETEYKQEGDLGGAFFKVRIIDVKPDSSEVTDKPIEEVTKDRELVENNFENEISKSKEIEEITEVDCSPSTTPTFLKNGKQSEMESFEPLQPLKNWDKLERFDDSLEDNNEIEIINNKPVDLSNDIYVNDILMNAGAPTNPDAEFIEVLSALPSSSSTSSSKVKVENVINPR